MRISLITINYNGSKETIRLLDSLNRNTDQDFDIFVVDNSSKTEDLRELKDWTIANHPKVKIIDSSQNLGFSGGNNLALSEAFKNGSDWALLINNDTWVTQDFMSHLKPILSPKKGLMGLPLDEGTGTAYGGRVEWFQSTLSHVHNPIEKDDGHLYIIGGGMAISKEAYEKIGPMDEKYFLYFEDADYTLRARNKNIEINFVREPKINHATSTTTKRLGSPLLLRYHFRNALYFNYRYRSHLLTYIWSIWILKKQLWKILFMYNQNESQEILLGVLDFWMSKMGKIK